MFPIHYFKDKMTIRAESIFIPINSEEILHLKHIYKHTNGTPIFLLHGAIENGKIFYSDSGKGLAYFLAEKGYDVYVADLRGRGKSTPNISKDSTFGQMEIICEDIPSFADEINKRRGKTKQIWMAHSWGGVLISSFLARNPDYINTVKCSV